MNKNKLILYIILIISMFISCTLLWYAFKIPFYDLLQEVLKYIFTGCLFAIPSYIVLLKENSKKSRRKLVGLLNDISLKLEFLAIQNYDSNIFENNRRIIVKINTKLINLLSENYFDDRKIIEALLEKIFLLSVKIKEVNEKINNNLIIIGDNEYNIMLNELQNIHNDCISLIEDIKNIN